MEVKNNDQAIQAQMWKFIFGFVESLVLKRAVDLEIADTIHKHGKPMTLSELASQLPKQPVETSRLYRIMRYLVMMELIAKGNLHSGEVTYGLLPPAMFLVRGWRKSMVPILLSIFDKDILAPWYYLKDGSSGDCDAFEKATGKKIWDYMSENPEKSQIFNEALACDTRFLTSALVNADCKSVFEGIKTLVDVGGGTGTAVKAIYNAFPHIQCSVYDLPHVIAVSPKDPNIDRIEGDMFKSVPCADAILMKCILHDWNDYECIEILKQCKKAVPRDGGKVIIVDIVLNVERKHPYTKMRLTLDLVMMLMTGGKERTEEEWKKLIESAGFTGYKITEISALQSVIEAYPY